MSGISPSYSDLVNISAFGKKREEFLADRGDVSYWCRDCRMLVAAEQPNPNRMQYVCPHCRGERISIGTKAGLDDFYHRTF